MCESERIGFETLALSGWNKHGIGIESLNAAGRDWVDLAGLAGYFYPFCSFNRLADGYWLRLRFKFKGFSNDVTSP